MIRSTPNNPHPSKGQQCPCNKYRSIDDVTRLVLFQKDNTLDEEDNDKHLNGFLQWLAQLPKNNDSCGNPCPNRGTISLAILNAIRDACRVFLEEDDDKDEEKPQSSEVRQSLPQAATPSYEESFPSLSGSNHLNDKPKEKQGEKSSEIVQSTKQHSRPPQSQKGPRSKQKRRIRPATLQTVDLTAVSGGNISSSVWGQPTLTSPVVQLQVRKKPSPEASQLLERRLEEQTVSSPAKKNPQQTESTGIMGNTVTAQDTSSDQLSNDSNQHPLVTESMDTPMSNLVAIYYTLITSCLVPSTSLELHLLLRLLAVSYKKDRTVDQDTDEVVLAPLFPNSGRCIVFAKHVLSRLASLLFGLGLSKSMMSCPPVRNHCEDLCRQLKALENDARERIQALGGIKKRTSNHRTAIFTLPFNPSRDSRHNFKSAEEQAIYKNREMTRDAFIHQLREYYKRNENATKPTVRNVSPSQMKQIARDVMDSLQPENISWFAEIFRDLLLQLGPVPVVQETDKEVLQMADSKRLEKLQDRLFGVSPTNKRPSRKSSQSFAVTHGKAKTPRDPRGPNRRQDKGRGSSHVDQKPYSTSDEQRLRHFKGYQEFFFLFLTSADSFQLNHNLMISLSSKMKEILDEIAAAPQLTEEDVERHQPELRVLARFIGAIIFSPGWVFSSPVQGKQATIDDSFQWLFRSGINPLQLLSECKSTSLLVLMVSWVVDLVKMGQWDTRVSTVSQCSESYQQILTFLRTLQVQIKIAASEANGLYNRHAVFLATCIESVLDENFGLVQTCVIKYNDIQSFAFERDAPLESEPSKELISSYDSHFDDLFDLIGMLSRPILRRTPGASRKLRPIQLLSQPSARKPLGKLLGSEVSKIDDSNSIVENTAKDSDLIQTKLRDMFFHQNGFQKDIVDFTCEKNLRYLESTIEKCCVEPTLKSQGISDMKDLTELRQALTIACTSFARSMIEACLRTALNCLSPPGCKEEVKVVAYNLGIERFMEMAQPVIQAAVLQAVGTIETARKKELLKKTSTPISTISKQVADNPQWNVLEEIRSHLQVIVEMCAEEKEDNGFADTIRALVALQDQYEMLEDSHIPQQQLLRSIYSNIMCLDDLLVAKVDDWTTLAGPVEWELFAILGSMAAGFATISRYGTPKFVGAMMTKDVFLKLLNMSASSNDLRGFMQLLVKLVDSGLASFAEVSHHLPSASLVAQLLETGQALKPDIPWRTLFDLASKRKE